MGRNITYIFLCLQFAGLGVFNAYGQSSGENSNFNSAEQFNSIDQYIEERMRTAHIPGLALAIVKGDQSVYLKGYGRADPSGTPVTPQTSFIIGSVTKAFTALAVMQLIEVGRVELDAPVQRYIPWFHTADAEASAKITVNQLLHQTSGLPMMRVPQLWTDQDDRTLERTVRLLQTTKTEFRPGQSFGYSNANFEALGLIVQSASGLSYEEYIRQHIFKPLDMQHSFVSQEEAMQHGMATGYRWWFGFPFPVYFPYNRSELPAGYLISSAEDMANFLVAQMNGGRYRAGAILSPNGIALTHTRSAVGTYCMGWESVVINGRIVITHDGGTANFQSSVFFDPEQRVGVFIAANTMCALDAFSSPPGSGPLDGTTVRAMAQSVLNLATRQPLPNQGRGIRNSYIIFDLIILILTAILIISIMRITRRYKKLKDQGIASQSDFLSRISRIAVLHFTWPLILLYAAFGILLWKVFAMFQPDLVYWLEATAVIIFLKGLLEIFLTWRVYRDTGRTLT